MLFSAGGSDPNKCSALEPAFADRLSQQQVFSLSGCVHLRPSSGSLPLARGMFNRQRLENNVRMAVHSPREVSDWSYSTSLAVPCWLVPALPVWARRGGSARDTASSLQQETIQRSHCPFTTAKLQSWSTDCCNDFKEQMVV